MGFHKFWVKEEGKEYDDARRRSAGQRAVIYYLVALYIGYMGYRIINNRLTGDDTMSYPLAITLTSVLIIGALWVAWYATRFMQREFDKSVLENENQETEQK